MEALSNIVDYKYKLVYLESTLGYNEKQIYLGWREYMKSDDTRRTELDEFKINITVLSFIDAIRKCILGSSMEEVDDVQKQVRAIRSLEQLKICDLHYFDHYVDLFYKYWSQIGRPYDENLLMKFVTKLPGKIGEKLYKDLTEWFKNRKEEGFFLANFFNTSSRIC